MPTADHIARQIEGYEPAFREIARAAAYQASEVGGRNPGRALYEAGRYVRDHVGDDRDFRALSILSAAYSLSVRGYEREANGLIIDGSLASSVAHCGGDPRSISTIAGHFDAVEVWLILDKAKEKS